jgi:hypothetical protein
MVKIILALTCVMLVGCAPNLVVMKNPKTGQMAQCQGQASNVGFGIPGHQEAEGCAQAYQGEGWVRLN